MSTSTSLLRRAHFLGAKVRSLRKRQNLTLEDLSIRCSRLDPESAPSVSYLSMIETGKRVPAEKVLNLLAEIFQKPPAWFLDENAEAEPTPRKASSGGVGGIPLEPGFLFSKDLLRTALPELLSQTGTTGRQFAQLLIRSHQEMNHNRFPDLERAAEDVGAKVFPLSLDRLLTLCRKLGLEIRWFDRKRFQANDSDGQPGMAMLRSFFEPPGVVYMNRALESQPARLKYELANHIGHQVLHDGDGKRPARLAGGVFGEQPHPSIDNTLGIEHEDILHAWRDFECSFFAGALLCPNTPFRQFLMRHAYDVEPAAKMELTTAVIMRRMTAVSPYKYWHYFDAYPPGKLRAVYRGNGIPLPWGNMRLVQDPCSQWAVFRLLDSRAQKPFAQLSVLSDRDKAYLYGCLSVRTRDVAGNRHVICAGIDLAEALEAEGLEPASIVEATREACQRGGGSAMVPGEVADQIRRVGRVLNIKWIEEGLESPANMICPRSTACPRPSACNQSTPPPPQPWIDTLRKSIIRAS